MTQLVTRGDGEKIPGADAPWQSATLAGMADARDDEDERSTLPRGRLGSSLKDTIPASAAHPSSTPTKVRLDESFAPPTPGATGERYQRVAILGEGGMGAVELCRDRRIGRDVALKRIRSEIAARRDYLARFEREARVQGQLEHPSVVPVYDLGADESGLVYFTMKRVRGRTLADVLDALARGDAKARGEFSTRRLLTAFSQVCLAIAFAHSRGVLHRDIKPENIMLGDFGEVSLLDWGIATVVEDLRATGEHEQREIVDAGIDEAHKTLAGEMVGSPGYMSPEQIRGDLSDIDERADVFALGCVLYEILTLEPLVTGTTVSELITRTLAGVDARARERSPQREVPPELELACIRATAPLSDRCSSARQLSEAVERYLDGDRDLARRRELATECLDRVTRAVSGTSALDENVRTSALRDLGAAVALDPNNERARELLGALLLQTPEAMPPRAMAALEEQRAIRRFALRKTLFLISLVFAATPGFLLAMGVKDMRYFAVMTLVNLLVPVTGFIAWRRGRGSTGPSVLMVAAMTALSLGSFVVGPLVHVPTNVLAVSIVWTALSARKVRLLALPVGVLAILVPLCLQLVGVLEPSYRFEGGALHVLPLVVELRSAESLLYLTSITVIGLVLTAFVVYRQQALLERLEERLFLHLYNLEKLVPEGAGVSMSFASREEP